MVLCQICSKRNEATYKCPNCRIPYCRVECFKQHKQTKCENIDLQNTEEGSSILESENSNYVTDNTLTTEKLKQLENSEALRKILSNKHVRDILKEIDSCKDPNIMLEYAMKEPIFVEFVDECLKLVEDRS